MIVGRGLIASLFVNEDQENVIFFASGVSNSLETDEKEFLREENLILKTIQENPGKIFVYFSTCSIYDSSKTGSDYVLHKLKMEQIVKKYSEKYLILRVSNVVGKGGNPNLLMNYLVRAAKNSELIDVHTKAHRNLIDGEDVKQITLGILEKDNLNRIINVAYLQNFSVLEILATVEDFFGKKLDLKLIKNGSGYDINIPYVEEYFKEKGKTSKETYLSEILEKYYTE